MTLDQRNHFNFLLARVHVATNELIAAINTLPPEEQEVGPQIIVAYANCVPPEAPHLRKARVSVSATKPDMLALLAAINQSASAVFLYDMDTKAPVFPFFPLLN